MKIAVVLFMGIVLVLIIGAANGPKTRTDEPAREPANYLAVAMCQQFAVKQLKAPATAKFGPSSSWQVRHEKGTMAYTTTGYVDAQNVFGALIRSVVSCDMVFNGGKLWTANKVEVD